MADQQRLKSSRQRNIAQALRKVDAAGREAAISARLDALERDALPDDDEGGGGDTMDEEFVVEEPKLDGAMTKIVPASKKKKKGFFKGLFGRKRKGKEKVKQSAIKSKTQEKSFNSSPISHDKSANETILLHQSSISSNQ